MFNKREPGSVYGILKLGIFLLTFTNDKHTQLWFPLGYKPTLFKQAKSFLVLGTSNGKEISHVTNPSLQIIVFKHYYYI